MDENISDEGNKESSVDEINVDDRTKIYRLFSMKLIDHPKKIYLDEREKKQISYMQIDLDTSIILIHSFIDVMRIFIN